MEINKNFKNNKTLKVILLLSQLILAKINKKTILITANNLIK